MSNKSKLMIILVIFLMFFISCGKKSSVDTYKVYQEEKIVEIQEKITQLQSEYLLLRFQIIERTDETIEIAIKFINYTGDDLVKTYKLLGREAHFDFFTIPVALKENNYCTFPYLLYTDEIAPKDGESLLTPDVLNDFIPISYPSDDFSNKDLKNISDTISQLRNKLYVTDKRAFGSVIHDITGTSSYKTGSVYRIISRTSGGLEVIEE